MAISSINFQKATEHSSAHNLREDKPSYLLPEKFHQGNEYWQHEKSEKEIFEDELSRAKRKGGPKPKLENSRWEAVVNLNKKHSLEDLQKVAAHIEKKFNITATEISIHRDEGKIENGKVSYNYHAHLNFLTYKDGKQNWRKEHIKPKNLSELQTEVANMLGMDRGKVNSKQQRLSHTQYKAVAREKEQLQKVALLQKLPEIAKNRDLQREKEHLQTEKERTELRAKEGTKNILNSTRNVIAKLKDVNAQLKEEKQALKESKKATKEDYAELRKKYDTLKEKAKAKDLTIEELQKALNTTNEVKQTLETKLAEKPKEVEVENPINRELEAENKQLIEAREVLQQEKDTLLEEKRAYTQDIEHTQNQLIEATQTIETQKTTIDTLHTEKRAYTQNIERLERKTKDDFETIQEIQQELAQENTKVEVLEEENTELKAEVKELNQTLLKAKQALNDIKAMLPKQIQNQITKFQHLVSAVKDTFKEQSLNTTNEVKIEKLPDHKENEEVRDMLKNADEKKIDRSIVDTILKNENSEYVEDMAIAANTMIDNSLKIDSVGRVESMKEIIDNTREFTDRENADFDNVMKDVIRNLQSQQNREQSRDQGMEMSR